MLLNDFGSALNTLIHAEIDHKSEPVELHSLSLQHNTSNTITSSRVSSPAASPTAKASENAISFYYILVNGRNDKKTLSSLISRL